MRSCFVVPEQRALDKLLFTWRHFYLLNNKWVCQSRSVERLKIVWSLLWGHPIIDPFHINLSQTSWSPWGQNFTVRAAIPAFFQFSFGSSPGKGRQQRHYCSFVCFNRFESAALSYLAYMAESRLFWNDLSVVANQSWVILE